MLRRLVDISTKTDLPRSDREIALYYATKRGEQNITEVLLDLKADSHVISHIGDLVTWHTKVVVF